ncbi:hypothetical protein Hanom_Chr06g00565121 [Helianthus anomalus]
MDQNAPALQDKIGGCNSQKNRFFGFWTKMATKCKPQGPRCNKFEIWTKVAKLAKPQGPKWQFTLFLIINVRKSFACLKINNNGGSS